MTKQEAVEMIRPLPVLKSGYYYVIFDDGKTTINKLGKELNTLFNDFGDFVSGKTVEQMSYYEKFFIPIKTKTKKNIRKAGE